MNPPDVSQILDQWKGAKEVPGGAEAFSRSVAAMAPYSGTIEPQIVDLDPGLCRIRIEDRPAVRNHLSSIHAAAQMNLAELSGSLAMLASLPPDARMIVKGLEIDFLKKARNTLVSEARCPVPPDNESQEYTAEVEIRDPAGDEVAHARVRLLVGPVA